MSEIKKKRLRLSQQDVPAYPIEQALRIPIAIYENYAGDPTTPLNVAHALDVQPSTGTFRMLCGSAIAYGLTEGGYNAAEIKITPLCLKILRPLKEGEDLFAKIEAFLRPRVINEFLNKYNGSQIPREDISQNIIEEMGVPKNKIKTVLELIIKTSESLGLIKEIKNKKYVDLSATCSSDSNYTDTDSISQEKSPEKEKVEELHVKSKNQDVLQQSEMAIEKQKKETLNRKVYISHGKNTKFVKPIKKLLTFGELEAVVSVDQQSTSKPVPEKVMQEMRSCGAAIIHVESEQKLMDKEAKEHIVLNPNVLIEVGAAMALYKKRFILLVKEGVSLPSNLQGLYEVRYNDDNLDGDTTIRLLEAINEMKKSE